MSIRITVDEYRSILKALTLALSCINDSKYLEEHSTEIRNALKKKVIFMDEKLKGIKK